jgi:glycosyltransferase involved in cell wall biosynthesis
MPLLSLVIPCYNEEEVIGETVRRLIIFCSELDNLEVELIFIDDGSSDRTLPLLKSFASKEVRMRIISFARNFGHQIAVTAGIDAASGDAVVLIDADLQDPPEAIHRMIEGWREGYDVVYGVRIERLGESRFKLLTARVFYRILNRLSDTPIPLDAGDFRLMTRPVIDALKFMPENDRFVRGMVSWIGFKQVALPYMREKRYAGKSKYPFKKMFSFAIVGILSFSTKPLRMSIGLGMLSALLALLGIFYALFLRIFTNVWVEGWTALFIVTLFLGGIQLVCVGIVGEYIGRIYSEVKKRPLYIVREYFGFNQDGPAMSRSPNIKSK